MKKLISHSGESLGETLISLLMIAVTFLFLTGSIVASMRVNGRIQNSGGEFRVSSSKSEKSMTVQVTVTGSDGDGNPLPAFLPVEQTVWIYSSGENGYYYYRVNSSGGT